jgi:hypothetical protein
MKEKKEVLAEAKAEGFLDRDHPLVADLLRRGGDDLADRLRPTPPKPSSRCHRGDLVRLGQEPLQACQHADEINRSQIRGSKKEISEARGQCRCHSYSVNVGSGNSGTDTPLRIPYGNKDAALRLGARYRAGGWYAPVGVELAAFGERGGL